MFYDGGPRVLGVIETMIFVVAGAGEKTVGALVKRTITAFCVRLPREWEGLHNRASPSRHMVGKADWENGWKDCKHTIYTSRPSIV